MWNQTWRWFQKVKSALLTISHRICENWQRNRICWKWHSWLPRARARVFSITQHLPWAPWALIVPICSLELPWAPYGSPKLPWTPLGSNSSFLLQKAWLYEIRANFLNLQAAKTSPCLWLLSTQVHICDLFHIKTVPLVYFDGQSTRLNNILTFLT